MLEQEKPGPGRAQLLGGRYRRLKVAVERIADDDHGSQRPLLRLPQRLLENAADPDIAAADAAGTRLLQKIGQIGGPVPAFLLLADNASNPPGIPSGGRNPPFVAVATSSSFPWMNLNALSGLFSPQT